MPNRRPYGMLYDQYANTPVQSQLDSPATTEFLPPAASNRRAIVGADGNVYYVADESVTTRGAKNVVWSSEGFTLNGVTVPALSALQKRTTGSQNTSLAAATPPSGFTMPTILDCSPYKALSLIVSLTAITGTSIAFELDFQDDSTSPLSFAVWKPAALTAATSNYLISVGPGVGFPPGTIPTGYAAANVPTNWTYVPIPIALPPNAQFQWTATALTAVTWTAWVYGVN